MRWEEVQAPSASAQAIAVLGEAEVAGLAGKRRYADLSTLIEAGEDGEAPAFVLVDFRSRSPEADLAAASRASVTRGLELSRAWLAAEGLERSRLVFLTEGALPVDEKEGPDLANAALCGLLRSARSEHPGRFALLDSDGSDASQGELETAFAMTAEEPEIALREGVPLVARLVGVEAVGGERPAPPLDAASTVLITGGTGELGSLLARHLVAEHDARHLLLVSRGGPDAEGADALREELESLGAEVRIVTSDLSQREQSKRLLDSIPAEHPLGGVVHAAGVLDDGMIDSLDAERIDRVFAPKAAAAWHLHELTAEMELSAFVMFSSATGVFGGPGQGNYAAANSFLDGLARHRHARGLPATALAWGPWELSGMATGLASAERARLARLGMVPLRVERGLDLFDLALSRDEHLLVPLGLDKAGLRAQARAGALPSLLRGLVPLPARDEAEGEALRQRLEALPETEREAVLLDVVRGHVAVVLGHASAHQVDADRAFKDLGFDSLAAVELRNRLAVATGLRLEPTMVFDYPTATGVTTHLLRELGLGAVTAGDGAKTEREARQRLAGVPLASIEEIDTMDIDELANRTLDRQAAASEIGGGE
jgi:NAD(P)-dependent dehydrogenase (short-subunit alcohol dehydrogenase family)/acyl carrier protein